MNKLRTVNLNLANYIANNIDNILNFSAVSEDKHTRAKIDVSNIQVIERSETIRGTYLFALIIPYHLYDITGIQYSRSELSYYLPNKLIKRSEDPEHLHVITNSDMLTHFFNMCMSHALTTLKVVGSLKSTYLAAMNYVNALDRGDMDKTQLHDIATYFGLERADIQEATEENDKKNELVHGILHGGVVDESKQEKTKKEETKTEVKQHTTVEMTPNLFGTNVNVKDKKNEQR